MEKLVFTAVVLAMVTLTTVNAMAIHQRQKRQNYDALLQNKAFVESQINCVLGRGQCDRIGHRIKVLVPEVVKTNVCKSCTEEEKGNVKKVADHVQVNYPKAWNEIRVQYKDELEQEQEEDPEQEPETDESPINENAELINEETSDNSVPNEDPSSTPVPTDKEEPQDSQEPNQLTDSQSQEQQNSPPQQQPEAGTQDQEQQQVVEEGTPEEVNSEDPVKKDMVDNTAADSATS